MQRTGRMTDQRHGRPQGTMPIVNSKWSLLLSCPIMGEWRPSRRNPWWWDILDCTAPCKAIEWGFTGVFAKENGGGFLTDHYPNGSQGIWDLRDLHELRHSRPFRFAGIPSRPDRLCPFRIELAAGNGTAANRIGQHGHRPAILWRRNYPAVRAGAGALRIHSAILGNPCQVLSFSVCGHEAAAPFAREHAATLLTSKNLTRGTKIYFPVYVEGAKLFVCGDIHFLARGW